MSQNETNNPQDPQETELSLKDKRRQLEELTPNMTAKQLGEQMARAKRQADSDNPAAPQDEKGADHPLDAPPDTTPETPASEAPSAEHSAIAAPLPPPTIPESRSASGQVDLMQTTDSMPVVVPTALLVDTTAPPEPPAEAAPPASSPPADTAQPLAAPASPASLPPVSVLSPADEALPTVEAAPVPPPTPADAALLQAAQTVPDTSEPAPASETAPDAPIAAAATHDAPEAEADTAAPAADAEPDAKAGQGELANKHDTAVLAGKSPIRRALQQRTSTDEYQTASLGDNREIILVIRGMVERLILKDDKRIVLGRTDVKSRFLPDVDLTPYGALDRGVSREHASLHMQDGHLYITDLNSTNGTYLANEKLEAFKPALLRKGDELSLGRLPVQVLFR